MNTPERRRHPRQESQIEVTVHKNGEKIPATLIDMSEGGIAIISDRELPPGTEVKITVNFIDDYSICGTVKWLQPLYKDNEKTRYRIGISADRILATEDIL